MQKHWKILGMFLLFIMVFSALPNHVRADDDGWKDDRLRVDIEYASYLDHDNDGKEDDVLTIFTIRPPYYGEYRDWQGYVEVTCLLVLPSDKGFAIRFETPVYEGIRVTIAWLNCAVEEGWYYFRVDADAIGKNTPKDGSDSVWFDPPEGEPAMPVIKVESIEQL